jgi:hypothetical protein
MGRPHRFQDVPGVAATCGVPRLPCLRGHTGSRTPRGARQEQQGSDQDSRTSLPWLFG